MHSPLRFTGVAGTTLISPVEDCNGRVGSTFTRAGTSRVDTFSCIYVTDGRTGKIKIFRGFDYAPIGIVKLLEDADLIRYDSDTKHLYVTNSGGGPHLEYALASGFRKK
jgi:hypothetical protein